MKSSNEVYTYRTGEKIFLDKNPNQFVIRALHEIVKEKLNIEKIKLEKSPQRIMHIMLEIQIRNSY
ncbi:MULTISPECIES: hypothetical protein [Bacillus]|uniref:hypothetical protein n=1 Tax=Bacillus TaxID=1386 RepID=UPI00091F13CC|nr:MULTISPECIES: hypothetical protein [Bacillus]PEW28587.1 hypothetical protein CN427_12285 [Bacillus thuringiensis]PFB43801.1 hypothetical protein CN396_20245 [Bacillus thuringiensis]PFV40869.1 hypothetical protein COL03_19235 [Bacillus thuringiensis]SHM27341.1 hypothetical protein SAMN04487918_10748 [Bacillus sp. bc15]